jgi:PPOX class probable F420-dependent enzyme
MKGRENSLLSSAMLDTSPHAHKRLVEDKIAWLTTVRPDGQPQTSAVWFLLQGEEVLVYSQPSVPKVANIAANPMVALNLDGDGRGGDIVTMEGRARIVEDHLVAFELPAYLDKYAGYIEHEGWTPESFSADYSVAIRIEPTRLRAW